MIDFLTVDVEGLDLRALQSNDWTRYRPSYVLVESLGMANVHEVIESELHSYMRTQGYSFMPSV